MENNEIVKEYMLEEIIVKSVQIPFVKVDRTKFLAEIFASKYSNLDELIEKGPVGYGLSKEELDEISKKLILKRTSQSSIASFASGIPGGLAMAATIPADVLQFFGMSLKLAQEISYLYGAKDLWSNGEVDEEKIKNQLILYSGVMFGVSGAVAGVRVLSTQVAKTTAVKLPQKALTKTFWYPILKKIANQIGIKTTKTTVANGISKVVPIVGGIVSGSLNFAFMMPMATRLKDTLEKTCFDYSEEEFEQDIDRIINVTEETDENEDKHNKIATKLSDGFKSTKKSISNITSEIKFKEKVDPYEEIKKNKELLDLGIITLEEFNKKKKELLDL